MRKTTLFTTAAILCLSMLSGCQKAPEASDGQDIPHAQGTLEGQIAGIAGGNGEENPPRQPGGIYEGTIGTTDNKIKINAEIPNVPENIYQMTLVPNDDIGKEALTVLLDSAGGNIKDTSQELLDEIQKSEYDNTHSDELFFYSIFGDHSALQVTDGERAASFVNHTSGGYVDYNLRDTYFKNAQNATLIPVGQSDARTGFPVEDAKRILLAKLEPLGITEVALGRIVLNEGNGYCYYEFLFTPSYEGVAVIGEIGAGYGLGELFPDGSACVTPEGVAYLDFRNFCGKIADQEPVNILSFEQVEKVLEQYLDSNMIQGDERLVLNNVKLEYYPVPNLAPAEGEMEYRPELELIPIWHIYMTLHDYVEAGYEGDGFFNICINAVTGELERVS